MKRQADIQIQKKHKNTRHFIQLNIYIYIYLCMCIELENFVLTLTKTESAINAQIHITQPRVVCHTPVVRPLCQPQIGANRKCLIDEVQKQSSK